MYYDGLVQGVLYYRDLHYRDPHNTGFYKICHLENTSIIGISINIEILVHTTFNPDNQGLPVGEKAQALMELIVHQIPRKAKT